MISDQEPIFIICTGRSGSTMLRYILDSHEKIDAPQELHLGPMIREMRRVVGLINENRIADNMDLNDVVNREVNALVHSMMSTKSKKEIWCDKSVSSIDYLEEIMEVFPNARYIFLYRDCLDFVHSALEVSKYGFGGFYFDEYILKNPGNLVEGLVNFWCHQTEKRIDLTENSNHSIYEIRYEDIVKEPSNTLRPLFQFLGLSYDDDLLESVFMKFRPGRGDIKVQSSSSIRDMTGKGKDVPLKYIKEETFDRMNRTLKKVGYTEIRSDYNFSEDGTSDLEEIDQTSIDRMFNYLESIIQKKSFPTEFSDYKIKLDIPEINKSPWLIDFRYKEIYNDNGQSGMTFYMKLRAQTLLKIVDGELNISWAYNQGMIVTNATPQQLNEVGKYFFG